MATIKQQQQLIDILADNKVTIKPSAIYFYESRGTLEFLESDWESWDEEQRHEAIEQAIKQKTDWDDAWYPHAHIQIDGYEQEE